MTIRRVGPLPCLVYFVSVAVGVLLQPGEAEPLVAPVLPEVAVHRIVLREKEAQSPSLNLS